MPLAYENLDDLTRLFMLQECILDVASGTLLISPRLNKHGAEVYPQLLFEAIERYDDAWLAERLHEDGCIKPDELRRKRSGESTVARVPSNAADVLAEGEFNKYYVRGLCARALSQGIPQVEIYRA